MRILKTMVPKCLLYCIPIAVSAVFVMNIANSVLFAAESTAGNRPNFLFVYADDQRYDQVGVVQREQGESGRYPWFTTPNMDRLAADGVRFRNAFVTSSLCSPSRAAYLTGQYNHQNGVASNSRMFPVDNVTYASVLRDNGYKTAYVGKWHMSSQRDRPGFDFHASFTGQGRYFDCPLMVQGVDTPTVGFVDDVTTGYGIDFIKEQNTAKKPWLLIVGLKSPHGPFTPPPRAEKRFTGEKARTVPNINTNATYLEKLGVQGRKFTVENGWISDVNLDHFRCVSSNDDNLGRLLDTLDSLAIADNTVVVYTSDNGFYFGEHGLADKRSAYDESLRVPCLVRFPKLGDAAKGKVRDEAILNIDLAPTFLDIAGVEIPKQMQGRSWKSLLEGKSVPDWRTCWFYEYFAEKQANTKVLDILAIRSVDTKLIKYAKKDGVLEDWTELYDMKNDPYELQNLHNDSNAAAKRQEMLSQFDKLVREVNYQVPSYADRPEWWNQGNGLPGAGPDPVPTTGPTSQGKQPDLTKGTRLFMRFDSPNPTWTDSSGHNNNGKNDGVQGVFHSSTNRKVGKFNGNASVSFEKTVSINCAGPRWRISLAFWPETPDGMVLAHGGKSNGYALWLKDRKLHFTYNADNTTKTIALPDVVPLGAWTNARVTISSAKQIVLEIIEKDKQKRDEMAVAALMANEPNDGLQIGTDGGSPVVEKVPNFTGYIEFVQMERY